MTQILQQDRLIKMLFSRGVSKNEYRSEIRKQQHERGIWQRRYWEHLIRDEKDYQAHVDYVHINPVKHGLVKQVKDWGGAMNESLSYDD